MVSLVLPESHVFYYIDMYSY